MISLLIKLNLSTSTDKQDLKKKETGADRGLISLHHKFKYTFKYMYHYMHANNYHLFQQILLVFIGIPTSYNPSSLD